MQIDGTTANYFGNGTWNFVPFSAMVFRESVLLNPHNLATETFTGSLEVLTFSMAMGMQLSYLLEWVRLV